MVKHLLVKNNLVKRDLDDSTNKPKVYWQTMSAKWPHTFWTKYTNLNQWEGSNCKQSTRWQHVSQLKVSAFCIW